MQKLGLGVTSSVRFSVPMAPSFRASKPKASTARRRRHRGVENEEGGYPSIADKGIWGAS